MSGSGDRRRAGQQVLDQRRRPPSASAASPASAALVISVTASASGRPVRAAARPGHQLVRTAAGACRRRPGRPAGRRARPPPRRPRARRSRPASARRARRRRGRGRRRAAGRQAWSTTRSSPRPPSRRPPRTARTASVVRPDSASQRAALRCSRAHPRRRLVPELGTQQVADQGVVGVRLPVRPGPESRKTLACASSRRVGAACARPRQGDGEVGVEHVDDAGRQQEVAHPGRLRVQHLRPEVDGDVGAGEVGLVVDLAAVAVVHADQPQARRPAAGPVGEGQRRPCRTAPALRPASSWRASSGVKASSGKRISVTDPSSRYCGSGRFGSTRVTRTSRSCPAECREQEVEVVEDLLPGQRLGVVQDQDDRRRPFGERGRQPDQQGVLHGVVPVRRAHPAPCPRPPGAGRPARTTRRRPGLVVLLVQADPHDRPGSVAARRPRCSRARSCPTRPERSPG